MAYDSYDTYESRSTFGLVAIVAVVAVCGVLVFLVARIFMSSDDKKTDAKKADDKKAQARVDAAQGAVDSAKVQLDLVAASPGAYGGKLQYTIDLTDIDQSVRDAVATPDWTPKTLFNLTIEYVPAPGRTTRERFLNVSSDAEAGHPIAEYRDPHRDARVLKTSQRAQCDRTDGFQRGFHRLGRCRAYVGFNLKPDHASRAILLVWL